MKTQFVIGVCILLLATCSAQPATADSGVQGQVWIGPLCPVVQEGQECPDAPYQATLTVLSLKGREIVQVQADENGRFTIPLEAGEYILRPESPNIFPVASEQQFVVKEGEFTELTVQYDSGIR